MVLCVFVHDFVLFMPMSLCSFVCVPYGRGMHFCEAGMRVADPPTHQPAFQPSSQARPWPIKNSPLLHHIKHGSRIQQQQLRRTFPAIFSALQGHKKLSPTACIADWRVHIKLCDSLGSKISASTSLIYVYDKFSTRDFPPHQHA